MKKCSSLIILLLATLRVTAQCPFNDCTASSFCVLGWCDNKPVEDVLFSIRFDGSAGIPPVSFNVSGLLPVQGAAECYKILRPKSVVYPNGTLIEPIKDDNPLQGISTFDLVKIARHVLNLERLPEPYGLIAADVDGTGAITASDMVELRKLVLGIYKELPDVNAWRFVDAKYVFPDPANPFASPFPQSKTLAPDHRPALYEFTGIKAGDVNCSHAEIAKPENAEERRVLALTLPDLHLASGQAVDVPLSLNETGEWLGLQGSLVYDPQDLSIEAVTPGRLRGLDAESWHHRPNNGTFNISWFDARPQFIAAAAPLLTLRLRALKPIALRDALHLNREALDAEAYDGSENTRILQLGFVEKKIAGDAATLIFEPQPNPFSTGVFIPVQLQEDVPVVLEIFETSGKRLGMTRFQPGIGAHRIEAPEAIFPHSGPYIWRIQAGRAVRSGKMIRE
jgi:hypothetical protein